MGSIIGQILVGSFEQRNKERPYESQWASANFYNYKDYKHEVAKLVQHSPAVWEDALHYLTSKWCEQQNDRSEEKYSPHPAEITVALLDRFLYSKRVKPGLPPELRLKRLTCIASQTTPHTQQTATR